MKHVNILFLLLLMSLTTLAQQRYLDEIFDDVTIIDSVPYGANITVITVADTSIGVPTLQTLDMDVYMPVGDEDDLLRPLVLIAHTGNFLPRGVNGSVQGNRQDSAVVEVAKRLARRGFVAATFTYRQGWNPISDDINVRVETLINAAYRGVQDLNTCIRFFKRNVAEGDNTFMVDTTRITAWGHGTGSYVVLAAATLDRYEDILVPKFFDSEGIPMVIQQINGDPFGLEAAPLNIVNHPGYTSDFQLSVNLGGALGDTTWIDESDPPMISFHVPRDPFAPYVYDILEVPTTGDLIVDVAGSYKTQEIAAQFGLNDVFADINWIDDITAKANERNDGLKGLYPVPRPAWPNPLTGEDEFEAGPWDWWNSAIWSQVPHTSCPMGLPLPLCNFDVISKINNPDMSAEKGRRYLDTVFAYFGPRGCVALDLGCDLTDLISSVTNLQDDEVGLKFGPNPATDYIEINSNINSPMQAIYIMSTDGKRVAQLNTIDNNRVQYRLKDLVPGMYIALIQFEHGIIAKKFAKQ